MRTKGIKLSTLILGAILILVGIAESRTLVATASIAAGGDAASIFNQKCAICHGKDGKGTQAMRDQGEPDFTDPNFQKSRTDAQLIQSIANGKGKLMAAYKGKVSDADIKGLVAIVRRFAKK